MVESWVIAHASGATMRSTARLTAIFPNLEVALLVLLVNHVFFSSELRQRSQSAQTSDLLTIENADHNIDHAHCNAHGSASRTANCWQISQYGSYLLREARFMFRY
jgi:hypothetical protein